MTELDDMTVAEALEHFGVKGMHWGQKKSESSAPTKLKISPHDTATTKRVKADHNNLSDSDFRRKYATSKSTYAKRVAKTGDPYAARSDRLKKADKKLENKLANRNTTKEIMDARSRHQARMSKIYAADQDVRLATTKKGQDAALKVVEKYAKEIGSTDDARVAAKMTRGEAVLTTALLGPLGVGLVVANHRATRKR